MEMMAGRAGERMRRVRVLIRAGLGRLPIRVRLTAWYVLLLGVILTALGAFLSLRLRADLVAGVDATLDTQAEQIVFGLKDPDETEFRDISRLALAGPAGRGSAAQLLSPRGEVLETAREPVAAQPMLPPSRLAAVLRSGQPVRATVQLGPEREPFRVLAVPRTGHGGPTVVVVAASLVSVEDSLERLQLLLLLAVPGALALAGGGGWLLARRALLPVARMTSQAAEIGSERLHDRVTVPAAADELALLGRTLNAMLDRIERGVTQQRRLIDDASHELRTPLAILRAELDVGLRDERLGPHAIEVLGSATEEVARMSRLVDDLLTLAHADEGGLQLQPAPVRPAEVAASVVAKLRPMAQTKRITLSLEGDSPPVQADRSRLAQVLTNLVDNAVKYTAPGGAVRVRVWSDADSVGVSAHDTGPGIAPEALLRVFDRFFRVDTARSRGLGGSGLGLAICKEIAQAHGGRIWVESEPGVGSTFTLTLPRRPGSGSAAPRQDQASTR
jgi:two-component system OmpR family sensor kinase